MPGARGRVAICDHTAIRIGAEMRLIAELFIAITPRHQACVSVRTTHVGLISILATPLSFSEIMVVSFVILQRTRIRICIISFDQRANRRIRLDQAGIGHDAASTNMAILQPTSDQLLKYLREGRLSEPVSNTRHRGVIRHSIVQT